MSLRSAIPNSARRIPLVIFDLRLSVEGRLTKQIFEAPAGHEAAP